MIEKIVMKDVASYSEAVFETNKKVNLIYGLNGTGKSTFSNFLYNSEEPEFSQCQFIDKNPRSQVFVYNQQFIRDAFFENNEIKGIFTLSKENSEIEQKIKKIGNENVGLKTELVQVNGSLIGTVEEEKEFRQKAIDKVWNIKKMNDKDHIFDFCLKNRRGNKEVLYNYLASFSKPIEEPADSIEDLKQQVKILEDKKEQIVKLKPFEFDVMDFETSDIFKKEIVGNQNSTIADFVEKVGNSDWIRLGLQYINQETGENVCPFCQQKTLTKNLVDKFREYFDESYDSDINEIQRIFSSYQAKFNLFPSLDEYINGEVGTEYHKDIKVLYYQINSIVSSNLELMKEKTETPSKIIYIKQTSELLENLNEQVKKINIVIDDFNLKIEEKEKASAEIKRKFWQLKRWEYDQTIELQQAFSKDTEKKIAIINSQIDVLNGTLKKNSDLIDGMGKDTKNIDTAINNINQMLLDLGIDSFKITKYQNGKPLYQLERKNAHEGDFKTFSEGEKTLISFLYFIELCKGDTENNCALSDRIIVVDDPVSSLSHIHVFNIGRLIHNEFLRNEKYQQIFVLTHSLYFFYELTIMDRDKREEKQNLYRIQKNNEGSVFGKLKYENIRNDYQAYWSIVNDNDQPPALIANCMRNIMEYFFGFVEKLDFNNIFDKPELKQTRFSAFYRYMNRESHSIGQNIFDFKEFDYDDFKEAFRLLFSSSGYEEHYKKMLKIKPVGS